MKTNSFYFLTIIEGTSSFCTQARDVTKTGSGERGAGSGEREAGSGEWGKGNGERKSGNE